MIRIRDLNHYYGEAAKKILPAIILLSKITTVAVFVWCVVIYAKPMLDTVGSYAFLSAVLFMIAIAVITYRIGFGLKQNQRSVISLGMLTRNGGPVLIAALAIPNVDSHILTLVVLINVGGFILAPIAARIFRKQAEKTLMQTS